MSNKSGWKNFEKDVAEALGGKRRHRTMGSYSTTTDDVRFRTKKKKKYPILKKVRVECKKRRELDIPALFAEATAKYGGGDKLAILATKRPVGRFGKAATKLKKKIEERYCAGGIVERQRRKRLKQFERKLKSKKLTKPEREKLDSKITKLKKSLKSMKKECSNQVKWETKLLRARMSNTALVTVTLDYFSKLFKAWKHTHIYDRTK